VLTAEHWPFIYLHPPGRIQLKIDFVTPVKQKITTLDQVGVLRLQAQHLGIAYFPQADETVVDSLLTWRLWDERGVQAHWMPKFGLAAGAYVNLNGAELQIMAMQEASHSEFDNAFEEALADPLWVARHAEIARNATVVCEYEALRRNPDMDIARQRSRGRVSGIFMALCHANSMHMAAN
jgi:hypothetical protein